MLCLERKQKTSTSSLPRSKEIDLCCSGSVIYRGKGKLSKMDGKIKEIHFRIILDQDLHSSVQTLCTTGTESCLGFKYLFLFWIINNEQQFKALCTWLNYLHSGAYVRAQVGALPNLC